MVLWHHSIPVDPNAAQIFGRGFLGVDFFFVLSGFLITTLLLRERSAFGDFSLGDFYKRRILRILPVYFFVVGAVSTFYVLVDGQTELAQLVPFYLVFLSNFLTEHIPTLSITWSLSVEEQYYMIWPLILLMVPTRWLIPLSLLLIALNVGGIMGIFGLAPVAAGPLAFSLPNSTYAPIIMGSLLALLLHSCSGFGIIETVLGGRWVAAAGFVVLAFVLQLTPGDLRGLPNLLVHTVMTAILAALVVREDNTFLGFLRNPVIARIGAVSYGIYLYHLLALDVANRLLPLFGATNGWIILLVYSVISYAIAELSFRTLEAYFRRFRPKLRQRPEPAC